MFDIVATGEPAKITWEEDGSRATVELDLSQVALKFTGKSEQPTGLSIELSRHAIYWLWGNLDRDIILELFRVQRDGGRSARLEEVARALGVEAE